MSKRPFIGQMALWTAVVGLCVPQVALAAGSAGNQTSSILDVSLQEGGTFLGQVIDAQGISLERVPVSLRGAAGELAATETNSQGYFAFRGLNNGLYQLVTPVGSGAYRTWLQGTAPPVARPGALIVAGGETVRGEGPAFNKKHALILGGVIAAAVAIPIAVNGESGPSSR
jgi:hypothetical protein